jgi:DNA-binding transcriptional LysR family regulator
VAEATEADHADTLTGRQGCINFRHGNVGIYRWELDKGDQSLTVTVNGPLIVDDVEVMIRAAIDGVGLAFASEEDVRRTTRVAHSCACSRIGVRLSPATSFTTPVVATSQPPWRLLSRPCV